MLIIRREEEIRRTLCKRFPYSIYCLEKDSNIIVLAVLHQGRYSALIQLRK